MDNGLLLEIEQKCPKKKVISCCNKLRKKCSYKSGASMEVLCELAYWLHVYGFADEVFEIAAQTHKIPFVQDFRVWTWIFHIWGLEIRILKERGCSEKAEDIISKMDTYLFLPKEGKTIEESNAMEQTRRSNEIFSYPHCTNQESIQAETSKAWINYLRLNALYQMIGDGATGFYPLMNKDMDLIENTIQEYIKILSAVK